MTALGAAVPGYMDAAHVGSTNQAVHCGDAFVAAAATSERGTAPTPYNASQGTLGG